MSKISENTLFWVLEKNKKTFPTVWENNASLKDGMLTNSDGAQVPFHAAYVRAMNSVCNGSAFLGRSGQGEIVLEEHIKDGEDIQIRAAVYDCVAGSFKALATVDYPEAQGMNIEWDRVHIMEYSESHDAYPLLATIIMGCYADGGRGAALLDAQDVIADGVEQLFQVNYTGAEAVLAPDVIDAFWKIANGVNELLTADDCQVDFPSWDEYRLATSVAVESKQQAEDQYGLKLESFKEEYPSLGYIQVQTLPLFFSSSPTKFQENEGEEEKTEETGKTFEERKKELAEAYALPIHALSDMEKAMVQDLNDNYVVDDKILFGATMIHDDWNDTMADLAPNVILEGDSGSGKTSAVKLMSFLFGIPYTKMTMSPTMESANLIGAFYPVFDENGNWEQSLSAKEVEALHAVEAEITQKSQKTPEETLRAVRRAFASSEVRSLMHEKLGIPSGDEIQFDPEGAWTAMGGANDAVPEDSEIALMAKELFENSSYAILAAITDKVSNGGVTYRFVLSELMKAFQHGWLVEIQEAASVLRPGVLTELNSLLEPNGRLELPNGDFIHRHPDTIVVFTTNSGYAGNAPLNESLRDRCTFALKMDNPSPEVMADRLRAQVGIEDKKLAQMAAEVISDLCHEAKTKNIRGSFGMRSLIAWGKDLKRGNYSEESFLARVIYKMTTNEEDIDLLVQAYRNSNFCRYIKKIK